MLPNSANVHLPVAPIQNSQLLRTEAGCLFIVALSKKTKAPHWYAHPSTRKQVYKLSTRSAGTTVCEGVGGIRRGKVLCVLSWKALWTYCNKHVDYGRSQRVRTCSDIYKCSTDISHKSLKSQQFMRLHLAQEEASQNLLQLCQ